MLALRRGARCAKAFGLSEDVQSALVSSIWGWDLAFHRRSRRKGAGLDAATLSPGRVLAYASLLMNFPRHLSQHVGGFVITRDRLDEVVPIMNTAMPDRYMIEWDKDDLDELKILKVDVLALGMLTCLAKGFKLLEAHYGKPITLAEIYQDHRDAVYDMICRADTVGVFQIESRAQMSMLPRLQPREMYDLVIEVAIVRPGPIQGNMVHPYLKRREAQRSGEAVVYPSPELKAVLERTLGVPLFQEQAMQIAITAAGFSPSEADRLRRAMATFKRTGTIHTFERKMVRALSRNGYEREFASAASTRSRDSANMASRKPCCLLRLSRLCLGLAQDLLSGHLLRRAPERAARWVLCTGANSGAMPRARGQNAAGRHQPFGLGRPARRRGFLRPKNAVHPRHASMREVIKTRKAVRLGFRLVKGLKQTDMEALVARRGEGYRSVHDLWLRSGLSRAVLERLADADAFRSVGLDRRAALWAVKALDEQSAVERLPLFEGAGSDDLQIEPKVALPEMPAGEQVIHDYRTLTLSLKAHPVSFMREDFSRMGILRSRDLAATATGRWVTVAGLVLVRQRPGSANGVIFMTIEDETGIANIIVWEKTFQKYRRQVMGSRLVKVRGRLQNQSGVIHVVADHLEDITPMLGLLRREARRFGVNDRADEVLRPSADAREKKKLRQLRLGLPARAAPEGEAAAQVAEVMPKGRNFH